MRKIFVINSGSSSLKFQLVNMPEESIIATGSYERIGDLVAEFIVKYNNEQLKENLNINTHEEAIEHLLQIIVELNIIDSLSEIGGVGHRVAHGGKYIESKRINEEVIQVIDEMSRFTPLHNPVNLLGIRAFQKLLPAVAQVAVFDTSFHQTIKQSHYIYPIPYEYYEKYGIRKYGFHGTSHQYIINEIEKELGTNQTKKTVSCHLGNGASICAIENGQSINTSMGFTPIAGLMMGTRSGDFDPGIVTYIQTLEDLSPEKMEDIMYKQSGLLGISGISNDIRDIEQAAKNENKQAILALNMYINRIAETIATYIIQLNGVDSIIFTAGVGENSVSIREAVCRKLKVFNIHISTTANNNNARWIEANNSSVKVGVIPTNEEIMIARDVDRLI